MRIAPARFALGIVARKCSSTIDPSRYLDLLKRSLDAFERHARRRPQSVSSDATKDVFEAAAIAFRLGLTEKSPALPEPDAGERPEPADADAWLAQVPRGIVVSRRGLAAGTGFWLDIMDQRTPPQADAFVSDNMERLVRNVEVARKRCLRPILPPCGRERELAEKWSVGILLFRYARRHRDLRMLNAAMKLVDWGFPAHRRSRPSAELARYVLAVAEQELAVRELL